MADNDVKIFHNPRCSKSRQSLGLLEDSDTGVEIIEYLQQPPTAQELKDILSLLKMSPRELMRKGESVYATLGLDDPNLSDAALIDAMIANPILIERPIVIGNGRAVIGRPPERVLDVIEP